MNIKQSIFLYIISIAQYLGPSSFWFSQYYFASVDINNWVQWKGGSESNILENFSLDAFDYGRKF